MTSLLRRLLPQDFFLRRWYSACSALCAGVRYGFPSRKMFCVGVTGTDGKTSTTECVAHVLRKQGKHVLSLSTISAQMGDTALPTDKRTTPSPWRTQKLLSQALSEGIDTFVLEVSSHALSQQRIFGIFFDVAVVTNVTPEHLDYHHTFEEYAKTKKKIFTHHLKKDGVAILNTSDKTARAWEDERQSYRQKTRSFCVAPDSFSPLSLQDVRCGTEGLSFSLCEQNKCSKITTPLFGLFHAQNITSAVLVAEECGFSRESSLACFSDFSGIPGRMQQIVCGQDFFVFVDFAVTLAAYDHLLASAQVIAGENRVILVFGSYGNQKDISKRNALGRECAKSADICIVADDEPYFEDPAAIRANLLEGVREEIPEASEYQERVFEIPNRKEAIAYACDMAHAGDVIVVAGMGHLETRNVSGVEEAWSDECVVREVLTRD